MPGEAAKKFLLELWKDEDIQVTVLISLTLQLLLLFAGQFRRRRISGFPRLMIWLAYVGADFVAVFAIGLLSEKCRKLTKDHTLPFLWAPFLLLHLGGQDTITAFSMEDNNLWQRHLLNLLLQVTLALYAFWKSFDILDSRLLAIAGPIFVAGVIKYGERTRTLYSGSREYLGSCIYKKNGAVPDYRSSSCGDMVASYALNTVLRVRACIVGRTLFQLGPETAKEVVDDFREHVLPSVERLKVIMAELGMMYDLLYTKAVVLQSRTGRTLRFIAETCMVAAFVVFLADPQLHARYSRADIIITYTLFAGALYMEACSVLMVIVSVWTRACLKNGSFLLGLSRGASSILNAIVTSNVQLEQQISMGQFNLPDYSMSQQRRPKLVSKLVSALGLEKQVRNFLHVEHIKDKQGISTYIVDLYGSGEGSQGELELGDELMLVLRMPFEHAIFRLHIYTDLYVSSMELMGEEMSSLAAECMTMANYLMHLMLNSPYMLPVGAAAQDLLPRFTKWVIDSCSVTMTKREILEKYTQEVLYNPTEDHHSLSPFRLLPRDEASSLKTIKEMWARLLIYAAGKCPMEMHARQLSNGVEPITILSLLMLQHAEGGAGKRDVSLFTSGDDPHPTGAASLVSAEEAFLNWRPRLYEPRHAFQFRRRHTHASLSVAPWAPPQWEQELLQEEPGSNLTEAETSSVTRLGPETEQQQAHDTLEDTSPHSDKAHMVVVIDAAALTPEMEQAVDAPLNTEQAAGHLKLKIEHMGEPGNPSSIAKEIDRPSQVGLQMRVPHNPAKSEFSSKY